MTRYTSRHAYAWTIVLMLPFGAGSRSRRSTGPASKNCCSSDVTSFTQLWITPTALRRAAFSGPLEFSTAVEVPVTSPQSTRTLYKIRGEKMGDFGKALLELAPSIIQAGTSIFQSERANAEAARQYNQNFAFNQETRNTNWQREDTQLQRATADAQAAGFSPLAALGNTASGATVSAPSGNVQGGQQADLSGLVGTIGQIMQNKFTAEEAEKQRKHETEMQTEKLNAEKDLALMNKSTADADRKSREKQAEADRKAAAENIASQIQGQKDIQSSILTQQASENDKNRQIELGRMYQEWYKENKVDGAPMGQVYDSYTEYQEALTQWFNSAESYLTILEADYPEDKTKEAYKGEAKADVLGILSSTLEGESSKESGGLSEYARRKWEAWLRSHPQPRYRPNFEKEMGKE